MEDDDQTLEPHVYPADPALINRESETAPRSRADFGAGVEAVHGPKACAADGPSLLQEPEAEDAHRWKESHQPEVFPQPAEVHQIRVVERNADRERDDEEHKTTHIDTLCSDRSVARARPDQST